MNNKRILAIQPLNGRLLMAADFFAAHLGMVSGVAEVSGFAGQTTGSGRLSFTGMSSGSGRLKVEVPGIVGDIGFGTSRIAQSRNSHIDAAMTEFPADKVSGRVNSLLGDDVGISLKRR